MEGKMSFIKHEQTVTGRKQAEKKNNKINRKVNACDKEF